MFKKKKVEPHMSWADNKMNELLSEIACASYRIREKAIRTYISAQALSVYGDCPDRNAAKKDLEEKQYSLRCSIGEYDALHAEIKIFMGNHSDECLRDWATDIPSSHEVILQEISKRVLTK